MLLKKYLTIFKLSIIYILHSYLGVSQLTLHIQHKALMLMVKDKWIN